MSHPTEGCCHPSYNYCMLTNTAISGGMSTFLCMNCQRFSARSVNEVVAKLVFYVSVDIIEFHRTFHYFSMKYEKYLVILKKTLESFFKFVFTKVYHFSTKNYTKYIHQIGLKNSIGYF